MGKAANERRKALFEQLKAEGKLNVPVYKPKKIKPARRRKAATAAAPQEPVTVLKSKCCIDRHGDRLPDLFRKCIDCTRDA